MSTMSQSMAAVEVAHLEVPVGFSLCLLCACEIHDD